MPELTKNLREEMAFAVQPNHFQSGFLDAGEVESTDFAEKALRQAINPDFSEYFGAPVTTFETVILSDLHLGSRFSRTQELLLFLKTVKFKQLIINGDVFDDINMKRLNRHHWRILSYLRELTDKDNNIEVIWIRGNHDGYSDLISQLLGIDFLNEYLFHWNGRKVLVVHGDYFDRFVAKQKILGDIGSLFYHLAFYLDPEQRISSWLKRNSRTYQRNLGKVREGAIHYAKHRHANVVICGHTHTVEEAEGDEVRYLNSGSWAGETPSYFVGVTTDQIKLVPFI